MPQTTVLHCRQVLEKSGILANNYLQSRHDGRMSHQQFLRSQQQFYFAVTFFSRPMSGLLARFPQAHKRLKILENLVEEHGSFAEQAFHERTFRELLTRLGSEADLDELYLWPCVRAFNTTLSAACILDEVEVGTACMGIIEYAFADISSQIGQAIVDRGWLPQDQVIHYALHEKIDREHA